MEAIAHHITNINISCEKQKCRNREPHNVIKIILTKNDGNFEEVTIFGNDAENISISMEDKRDDFNK